jgi:hypothetical protein
MTITSTPSEFYSRTENLDPSTVTDAGRTAETSSDEQKSRIPVPKLAVFALSLFGTNIAILGGIAASPDLRVGLYGLDDSASAYHASVDKPSPFTPVVDTEKPRKVRVAERVSPILYQEPVMAYESNVAPTELAIPRASQVSAAVTAHSVPSSRTVTGAAAYRVAESYGEFRRATAVAAEVVTPPTPRRVTN